MLNIFNFTIDYQGQDLHILRNGVNFPFHKFFRNNINDLSYTFRLAGPEVTDVSTSYEKINIDVIKTGTKVDAVNINASKFENTSDYQINNFYITVESSSLGEKAVILVHLHNTLDKIWTSPEIPSFRNGMYLKFGLMGYFNDNIFADLSFYPEIEYAMGVGASNIFMLLGNRLVRDPNATSYPAEASLPQTISDVVEITIPGYLRNTSTAVVLNCNVKVLSEFGILTLHSGDITKIDTRTNILFLSDGFDGSAQDDAAIKNFHDFIINFENDVLKSTSYTPWNYLKENINIWSYYLNDVDRVASIEGDYVMLNTSTAANIYHFMILFNTILRDSSATPPIYNASANDFIKALETYYGTAIMNFIDLTAEAPNLTAPLPIIVATNANSTTPIAVNFIDLTSLCGMVGFPAQSDVAETFSNMIAKWKAIGWISNNVKVQGDPISAGDLFLHEYVFKVWKKLYSRIMFEKADTTYGMTNADLYRRNREDLNPYNLVFPGISKFRPVEYNNNFLTDFGKFINKIKGNAPETQNFGSKLYGTNGVPVLKGNTKFDKIIKQCDNIVILSRVKASRLYGANISYRYSDYIVHRSVVTLEEKAILQFPCISIPANAKKPTTYKVNSININTGNIEIKNTIAHEFSHNYLKDEYSGSLGNTSNLDNAVLDEQLIITTDVKSSNLQTGYELKPANQNQITIDGDLIKWRWPRIKKIGIGKLDLIQDNITDLGNNTYSCKLKNNAIDKKDTNNFFEKNDKIFLRKRFLFDTDYIECTIEAILNQDTNFQEVIFKPASPLDIFQRRSYDDGFMLILPFWDINDPNKYQELVHHEIREAISTTNSVISGTGRPLVALDNLDYNVPQVIDSAFLSYGNNTNIIRKFTNPSLVVGLYAGGIDKYSAGLYHASGFCLMRGATPGSANRFCPVCSYIMIDYINPIKHALADTSYGVYPV